MIRTKIINTEQIEVKPELSEQTIVVCKNIKKIQEAQLQECDRMIYLDAPKLEIIEKEGLYWCFSLTCINFPNLRQLGDSAVCQASTLKVVILDRVEFVESWTFVHCNTLRYVQMNSVTELKEYTFGSCVGLQRAIFHSVISITNDTFNDCNSLEYMEIPLMKEVTEDQINSHKLVTFSHPIIFKNNKAQKPENDQKLNQCIFKVKMVRGCTLKMVRTNVKTVAEKSFRNNNYLIFVNIPNATKIGPQAFESCHQLMEVKGNKMKIICKSAFEGCSNLTSINLENATEIQKDTFNGCFNLNNLNLSSLKDLAEDAFQNCPQLLRVQFDSKMGFFEFQSQQVGCFGKFQFISCLKNLKSEQKTVKQLRQYLKNLKNDE